MSIPFLVFVILWLITLLLYWLYPTEKRKKAWWGLTGILALIQSVIGFFISLEVGNDWLILLMSIILFGSGIFHLWKGSTFK